jgi:uncharacterized membrane protein YhaH (DUF805 family)
MAVIRLTDGSLWVHSPVNFDEPLRCQRWAQPEINISRFFYINNVHYIYNNNNANNIYSYITTNQPSFIHQLYYIYSIYICVCVCVKRFRQLLMSCCHCGSCALFSLLGYVESLQAQGLLNQDVVHDHVLLTELLHAVSDGVVL